jgi:hypothetical protein
MFSDSDELFNLVYRQNKIQQNPDFTLLKGTPKIIKIQESVKSGK